MWSSVEEDFRKILNTRVFHTLADDSGYVEIFRKAGFKGKLPTDLSQAPAAVRQELNTAHPPVRATAQNGRGLEELSSRTACQSGGDRRSSDAISAVVEQGPESHRAVVVYSSPAKGGPGAIEGRQGEG